MGTRNEGPGLIKRAAGASLLGALGWLGYSKLFVPHNLPLPPAIEAERREMSGRAGRMSYYLAGSGRPLLLIHSINAAGSAYEMRPLFERYRGTRRVYAPDLPGFGFSDRSDREYSVRLYVDAIHDMVDAIEREAGAEGVDAVALSLASEFLARAAVERPERFRTLTLVTPTGFGRGSATLSGDPGSTREIPGMYAALNVPLWERPLFDLLASKPSIRWFLERTWGSKNIDEGLLEYDYVTTHQPGAQNAPYAFVSGKLFSQDIRRVYERLALPVWMPHGTRGDFGNFSEAGILDGWPNWTKEPFDSGALPHFERPEQFFTSFDRFQATAPAVRAYAP
jgi:pimeloyl-ACP methyl ester carboxylesterase